MPPSKELGDATQKEWLSLRIERSEFDAIAKVIVGDASPDDRTLLEGMVARVQAELCARTARHPLAVALEAMNLKERRAALDKHYAARQPWTQARSGRPTPEDMRVWLDTTFPDRRALGLLLHDLKRLDKPAFWKVEGWSRKDSGVSKATIDGFGLGLKRIKYDPERDGNAPKSMAEVCARSERGEDTWRSLNRACSRAAHHRPRP